MSYAPEQLTPTDAATRIRKLRGGISFYVMASQHARSPDNVYANSRTITGCISVTRKSALQWLKHLAAELQPGFTVSVSFPTPKDSCQLCFIGSPA